MSDSYYLDPSRELYDRGRTAYREGRFQEAVELLEESAAFQATSEGHPVTLQFLALAYLELGRPEAAIAALDRVQESGREHSGVVIARMRALRELGDRIATRDYWKSIVAKPNSPQLTEILDWMAEKT